VTDESMTGEYPPLECSCIVYRALLRREHVDPDSGNALAAAFMRRRQVDVEGLSVSLAEQRTAEEVAASFNRCRAVVSLHVGRVRNLSLDVIQDEPDHANITGVPYPDDDPDTAEYFAGELARQSRTAYLRRQ
jgi:hypothetical protein